MRWSRVLAVLWLGWVACGAAYAGGDRIVKVLPHYLDVHGKHAVSPSLFERDAYQAMLKANPDKRGGMQFDVRWKSGVASRRERVLRLEAGNVVRAAERLAVPRCTLVEGIKRHAIRLPER